VISQRTQGDVTVLEVQGRLTLGEATEELRQAVTTLLEGARNKIVLELSGVPYVDSAGLGEIVRAVTNAKRAGGATKLANPTQRLIDLLRIAKVQSIAEAFPSEEAAIGSFDAPQTP
jgi:anti-anti-sigma factor